MLNGNQMELEEWVKKLMELEETKKRANSAQYQAEKEYNDAYAQIEARLKAGHNLPAGSDYFVGLVKEPRGTAYPASVFSLIKKEHPELDYQRFEKRVREELVERLKYGKN